MESRYYRYFKITFAIPIICAILVFSMLSVNAPLAHAEDPFFSIALSKFKNEQDAAKEESRLKNSGHNAFYREEKSPDNKKTFYQIYIEKYNSSDEAEKEARVLKELELISDYTVKEVREPQQTTPAEITPIIENGPEISPPPQATEIKNQAVEPTPGPEVETTAPEPTPTPENQTTAPEPNPEPEKQTTAPEPNPVTEQPEPAHIDEPKETYIKSKPVINHDDSRLTGASLQVGAFSDEANAASLKKQLRDLGKNAFYRHESADGKGLFYRLYITGYSSLHEAIKDAKELLESGVISGYSRVHSSAPVPETTAEEPAADQDGKTYFIHISSNKDEKNAAENVARLKEHGYKAFYVFEKEPAGSWYRVYIGEFKNEAEARKKGMELLDRGLISYFKPIVIDKNNLTN